MIGKGLKIKELKQMIKDHNKISKPNQKIKGYGKMKKKELQEAIQRLHNSVF